MHSITYTHPQTVADCEQIVALQCANLPVQLSASEMQQEGFVTLQHSADVLWALNQPYPHITAYCEGQLVGYALAMLPHFGEQVPELLPMIAVIEQASFKGKALATTPYFIMGQICVAKGFRGQGIFQGLYQQLQQQLSPHFELLVTAIDKKNTRSLRAHEKVGFVPLEDSPPPPNKANWQLVVWDW